MAEVTYLEAIREALTEEMERDPDVFCLGEDIGAYGGAFKVTEGLQARFGARRVVDTPISEAGFVGAGPNRTRSKAGQLSLRMSGDTVWRSTSPITGIAGGDRSGTSARGVGK